jgi:4-hydroxy-3-methylbut-2-enyl diphosphate reductase
VSDGTAPGPDPEPGPVTGRERRRVLLASPRGFCAGVERAVATVVQALERYGSPVYVRHQIVHNAHVVRELENMGAIFVEDLTDVPGDAVLILSAHGVSPAVSAEAGQDSRIVIDATCPLVAKVHKEARRFADEGYDILLIGHAGHEEVIGTIGHAPDQIHLVDGPDSALEVRDEQRVAWLSQTTLSADETTDTVARLKARFPALVSPPSDDICYATQNRQNAVKLIAAQADLVLVIGSGNSSNSARLVEVALAAGAPAAYLVDTADGIDQTWLEDATAVGVTSGASAPEILVRGVIDRLAALGFTDVETYGSVEETQHFAMPRHLDAGGDAHKGTLNLVSPAGLAGLSLE